MSRRILVVSQWAPRRWGLLAKPLGTSILDMRDPKYPRVVLQIALEDPGSHSHKARGSGDIMIVNSERNMTPIGRRAEDCRACAQDYGNR